MAEGQLGRPVKERPIIFSGPMVQAILAGTKTQTRRVVLRPDRYIHIRDCVHASPYGVPGDRLWVRETWRSQRLDVVAYRADGEAGAWIGDGSGGRMWIHHGWIQGAAHKDRRGRWFGESVYGRRWQPSIHMPRDYYRINLELTEVRVQRLQEISEEDARAEGCDGWMNGHGPVSPSELIAEPGYFHDRFFRQGFTFAWNEINHRRGFGWDTNPFVWALTFRRAE